MSLNFKTRVDFLTPHKNAREMSLPGCECMSHVPGKDREGLGNVLMLGGGRGDSLGTRAVSSGETGPGL